MNQTLNLQPFLKCAGGKRNMIKHLVKYLPNVYNRYYEPFLGGASFFLYLKPKNAVISDISFEVMNLYSMVRDQLPELKLLLDRHQDRNSKDYFLKIRELDREPNSFQKLSELERAARFLYLNKTCYGGLTRYNKAGFFNTPYANYKSPTIYLDSCLDSVSAFLLARKRRNKLGQIEIKCCDFQDATKKARSGSFIYFDPPYLKLSASSSFSGYHHTDFLYPQHERLRDHCNKLIDRGCQVMISNSDTEKIRELYKGDRYIIHEVQSNRCINSDTTNRGKISELIITSHYQTKEKSNA